MVRGDGPEQRLAQGNALGADLQGGEEGLRSLGETAFPGYVWSCLQGLGGPGEKLLPTASEVTEPTL